VIRRMRLAAAALVSLLAAGGAVPAATLKVECSPARPKQGDIVFVALRADSTLSSATVTDGDRHVGLEADGDGRTFRGLLGIDFESKVGRRTLEVEARGAGGETVRTSRTLEVVSGKFPTQKLKVAPAYVEPPAEELARIARDREEVARVWAAADSQRLFRGAFRMPVTSDAHGSFGVRRVFNGKPRSSHDGVDLPAAEGAPVEAPAPATVALAGDLYFSGGTVILDHGRGLFTTYFHLSAIDVKAGETVASGQRVGAVGATGRATGPHLHWGARLHRARVNPLDLLKLPAWPAPDTPRPSK
jgi:murein DD-endopeptidase MepM/ murein hydrolase activator NlpD